MILKRHLLAPALAFAVTLALTACDSGTPATAPADAQQAQVAPAPAGAPADGTAPQAVDPGFAPVTSRGTQVPMTVPAPPLPAGAGASDGKILAPGAVFEIPAGWQSETPSSSMRLAQLVAPGSLGPGQMAVFYFGAGGGGGVEDNLQRWVGQMDVAAGTTPERGTFPVGPFNVSWIAVDGTLKGGTMGGPSQDTPGSTLLGAVVEGEQGPYFFKLTGPSKTIAEQREAFLQMLRSARP